MVNTCQRMSCFQLSASGSFFTCRRCSDASRRNFDPRNFSGGSTRPEPHPCFIDISPPVEALQIFDVLRVSLDQGIELVDGFIGLPIRRYNSAKIVIVHGHQVVDSRRCCRLSPPRHIAGPERLISQFFAMEKISLSSSCRSIAPWHFR